MQQLRVLQRQPEAIVLRAHRCASSHRHTKLPSRDLRRRRSKWPPARRCPSLSWTTWCRRSWQWALARVHLALRCSEAVGASRVRSTASHQPRRSLPRSWLRSRRSRASRQAAHPPRARTFPRSPLWSPHSPRRLTSQLSLLRTLLRASMPYARPQALLRWRARQHCRRCSSSRSLSATSLPTQPKRSTGAFGSPTRRSRRRFPATLQRSCCCSSAASCSSTAARRCRWTRRMPSLKSSSASPSRRCSRRLSAPRRSSLARWTCACSMRLTA
mmetsp:Transcript_34923/g.74515  ORF Transcript_34923/g.74515 Transcript_34923/m.74515 type:complete len:272 (+) Transcript_34923:343-1158(+)